MNDEYLSIIEPKEFIKNFTKDEFIEWLKQGTKQDLKCTLKQFEDAELYEICILIKKEINEK